MRIIIPAIVETITTRNDGSVKVSIGTQELDSSQAGQLFQLRGKYCKVLISDKNITTMDASVVDSEKLIEQKPTKSQSKRLKNVMFVFHQQQGMSIDFETFYSQEMEKLIEGYKEMLQ